MIGVNLRARSSVCATSLELDDLYLTDVCLEAAKVLQHESNKNIDPDSRQPTTEPSREQMKYSSGCSENLRAVLQVLGYAGGVMVHI